ncbi:MULTISPECIES: efflux RND transporter periplasmic adaptor subunit [unclassified Crossiella]|uniref:efflux RND transporter periplasmic adaptor subunit n=1 Tax=unclassified Crossiella TaxID=2620835 RepID=UPI001FFFFD99|nr:MULTISPECIES: HlyD family efflux transporter periplasmic adaptor subunit [unclassified Crossiella]MCK2236734.1 biotin/lipoyl-binding protein [Crossiella sp. S99.2]MCK2250402.1 biotin/lipoyl-binding protein [Crossiella sp. S99.1]
MLSPTSAAERGPSGPPTATVSRGSVVDSVSAAASLRASRSANVDFGTSAIVNKVFVKLGDKVSKSQKLATVDDRQAKAQLDAAKAQLESAKAAVTAAKEAKQPTTGPNAQVKQAELQVETAQDAVRSTIIYAPFAGTVTAMNGAVGQRSGGGGTSAGNTGGGSGSGAGSGGQGGSGGGRGGPSGIPDVPSVPNQSSSGSGFLTVTDLTGYQIAATFSEIDIVKVKVGQAAQVAVNALGGKKFPAKVVQVDLMPASSSGVVQYGVLLELDETSAELKPGQSANVVVTTAKADSVLQVPSGAVQTVDGKSTVTVMANGQPKPTPVQLGVRSDHIIEITSGLREGDVVLLGDSGGPGRFPEGGFPGKSAPVRVAR